MIQIFSHGQTEELRFVVVGLRWKIFLNCTFRHQQICTRSFSIAQHSDKSTNMSVQNFPLCTDNDTNVQHHHALYCTFLFCHRGLMSDIKWKNTFGTLEKYIWKFGQILLVFWTNILKISTNIFSNHALYCTFLFCHRGIMSDLKWDYTY